MKLGYYMSKRSLQKLTKFDFQDKKKEKIIDKEYKKGTTHANRRRTKKQRLRPQRPITISATITD